MCTVSMVGDFYGDKFRGIPYKPWEPPTDWRPEAARTQPIVIKDHTEEIAALRREIADMKDLLRRAIKYDERSGQPECFNDDKIAFLRKVAESVGISLDDVFGKNA